jgi:uncharacterized Tic20 family protein
MRRKESKQMTSENDVQLLSGSGPSSHSSDKRTWAALAHASALLNFVAGLGGLIASFVIWLTKKDESEWVAFHSLQSLVFQGLQLVIALVVVGGTWALGFAFSFLTLGFGTLIAVPLMFLTFFLGILIMIGGLGYSLYGAYQVYNGGDFRYLWVGDWIERRVTEPVQARATLSAETTQSNNNSLIVVIVVLIVLVLCVCCAVASLIALGIAGGMFAYNASAWLPGLLYLVCRILLA